MPRVLLISYTFPPVGGGGVQRVTKWLKYLPSFGWDASVLTTENPSVPVTDTSLSADVPPDTLVGRARTLEPGYTVKSSLTGGADSGRAPSSATTALRRLVRQAAMVALQPDPQVLWAPAALAEGRRLLASRPHDVVLATSPPYSALLIGARLARRARLPLVVDFRDEWGISNQYWENKPRDPLSHGVQRLMQRMVLRRASVVIATTEKSAAALQDACREAGSRARVICLYNGYDDGDFAGSEGEPPPSAPYRLAYLGTLWRLTDVRPLVAGVARLAQLDPESAASLELFFAGRRTPEQDLALGELKHLPCRLVTREYLAHTEAVALMRGSSGLCLLVADVPGADRVVPAKLFEYMAARRPILTLAPRGEVWNLLAGHPAARLCEPGDADGIAAALRDEVARHRAARATEWGTFDPSRFSRARQASELAEVMRGTMPSSAAARP
jgi:glycosyltransferase involved in cell wall biosynthesis